MESSQNEKESDVITIKDFLSEMLNNEQISLKILEKSNLNYILKILK